MRAAIRLSLEKMRRGDGRAVRRGRGAARQNRRARLEPGDFRERPDGARGGYGHPRGVPPAQDLPAGRLRDLHQLRAVPDVPGGDLLGADRKYFYAGARHDAAAAGFDDDLIGREMARPVSRRKIPTRQLLRGEALIVFKEWRDQAGQSPLLKFAAYPFVRKWSYKKCRC